MDAEHALYSYFIQLVYMLLRRHMGCMRGCYNRGPYYLEVQGKLRKCLIWVTLIKWGIQWAEQMPHGIARDKGAFQKKRKKQRVL